MKYMYIKKNINIPEIIIVGSVLAIIHLFLWWRYAPIAHVDFGFYTEPAFLLAKRGIIAGPASQYLDLTYTKGIYFYPPGYALILGGWIKLFRLSIHSLLAYTNLIHAAYLFALWVLLRKRFKCTRLAAALTTLSAFPMFNHGRPDVTALFLGALAWLIIPQQLDLRRLLPSGILLGLAVLVSPPFGISSAATVGTFYFVSPNLRLSHRAKGFMVLTGIAVLTLIGIWAFVLTWQNAWAFGPEQFRVNSANRGSDLNQLPLPPLAYGVVFILVPLVLMTLIPLVVMLYWYRCSPSNPLVTISLSYLGGFIIWFSLSKSPLLMIYHFSLLSRPVFHGVLASYRQKMRFLAIGLLAAFTVISFYFHKDQLLVLTTSSDRAYAQVAAIKLDPDVIAAVDSQFLPLLYRNGKTINYQITKENSWERYRAATSPKTMALLPEANRMGPLNPNVIIVSALTIDREGIPNPSVYRNLDEEELSIPKLRLFGRTIKFPQDPLKPYIFYRISDR